MSKQLGHEDLKDAEARQLAALLRRLPHEKAPATLTARVMETVRLEQTLRRLPGQSAPAALATRIVAIAQAEADGAPASLLPKVLAGAAVHPSGVDAWPQAQRLLAALVGIGLVVAVGWALPQVPLGTVELNPSQWPGVETLWRLATSALDEVPPLVWWGLLATAFAAGAALAGLGTLAARLWRSAPGAASELQTA